MSKRKNFGSTDTAGTGETIASTSPGWAGWLFFLIGCAFLATVYGYGFRPTFDAGGFQLFQEPEDIDLWVACAIVVAAFSGAGAAILAQGSFWRRSRSWNQSLVSSHSEEPWKWRDDWASGKVTPERYSGRPYFVWWGGLCLLAAAPGLEWWLNRGGWPDHMVAYSAIGSAIVGVLALLFTLRAVFRDWAKPYSRLHLAAETGVLGGPLEGAIQYGAGNDDCEYVVRLVSERHWIKVRTSSDNSRTRTHEIATEHDESYRAFAENGLIPIRFAVPFHAEATSTDWSTPVYLWFVELEDTIGKTLGRFWTPVFKTSDSDASFELSGATADRSIADDTPEHVLQRHAISVTIDVGGRSVMTVPAGQTGATPWALGVFGAVCLGVSAFMLPNLWQWDDFVDALFNIFTGLIFGGVFGLFGVLLSVIALQMLFERRRITFGDESISVKKTYFGLGWTSSVNWSEIKAVIVSSGGSTSGKREKLLNVVAMTDGMTRKDGSHMSRRFSIVNAVPDEAARAARSLILEIGGDRLPEKSAGE